MIIYQIAFCSNILFVLIKILVETFGHKKKKKKPLSYLSPWVYEVLLRGFGNAEILVYDFQGSPNE